VQVIVGSHCMPINRVGQNHIHTVCIRYFWQGNHHIYGHIRCIYTVLANPTHKAGTRPVQKLEASQAGTVHMRKEAVLASWKKVLRRQAVRPGQVDTETCPKFPLLFHGLSRAPQLSSD